MLFPVVEGIALLLINIHMNGLISENRTSLLALEAFFLLGIWQISSSFHPAWRVLVRVSACNLAGKLIFMYSYLLQVETLHDFEAANSDELTLQRGDVVLVVPSDSEADQVKEKIGRCFGLH